MQINLSKKLGLIGDIHCQNEALEKIIQVLRSSCEQIFCTGDIVDGYGDPNKCIKLLLENNVLTVSGNHDRWLITDQMRTLPDATERTDLQPFSLGFLKSCPATVEFITPLGNAMLCHGLGQNDMRRLTPDDSDYALESNDEFQKLQQRYDLFFIMFGHTHRRMVKRFKHQLFINPGSIIQGQEPGFQIIDFANKEIIQYEQLINEVKEIGKFKI